MRSIAYVLLLASTLAPALAPTSAQASNLVMGALGDSITTGFNATGIGDRKIHSWSTGSSPTYVNSHFQRIQKISRSPVEPHNLARAGDESDNLNSQLIDLLPLTPDYVTLLIGGNDLCNLDSDPEIFLDKVTHNVADAIDSLVAASPHVKINLIPVPDAYRLWEVSHVQSGARCQSKWDFFRMCPSLLHSRRTPAERETFRTIWRQLNLRYETIAADHPENVRFATRVAETGFAWPDISPTDCFHPSAQGQALLAEAAWETSGMDPNLAVATPNRTLVPGSLLPASVNAGNE